MIIQQLSESTEMYLKAMVELSDREMVGIGRLAERLRVTSVSANEMVRRLSEQGLVKHTPYKGVALTKKGREAACNVLRRQRLWECFLYDHLKIEWALVYEFACSLEHATGPEVTEALGVHPFVAEKSFKQARAFSMETLSAIYHRLLAMDEAAKTGGMPLDASLDMLIVELAGGR